MLNAYDMTLYQNKIKGKQWVNGENEDREVLWMEMRVSRFTPYRNLGTKENPGLFVSARKGPCIEAIPGAVAQ